MVLMRRLQGLTQLHTLQAELGGEACWLQVGTRTARSRRELHGGLPGPWLWAGLLDVGARCEPSEKSQGLTWR